MQFNVGAKLTEKQLKTLDDEKIVSDSYVVAVGDVQNLLSKNRTLPITNPLEFVANQFNVTKQELRDSITVSHIQGGYLPRVDPSLFDSKRFVSPKQINDIKVDRRPVFDRAEEGIETCWRYKTESGARMAALVHLLMNTKTRNGPSWTLRYLLDTKEVLLLIPASVDCGTMRVIATVYRKEKRIGTKVLCRYFDYQSQALPPIEVGRDNFGVFERSFMR
jgi:hypothetical protein